MSLGLFNLTGLIPLGTALLWAVQLVYRHRTSDDVVRQILMTAAWIMLLVGLFGLVFGFGSALAVPLLLVITVVAVMVVRRYRVGEQKMLLWAIAVAAEKGIPLPHAVRAFANERSDEMGLRAARLADLLDEAVPLIDALRRSRHRLSTDAELALRMGIANASLGPSLRGVVEDDDSVETTLRSMFDKYTYLLFIAVLVTYLLTFMMLFIAPTFREMFDDFGLALPATTELVFTLSDLVATFGFVLFPVNLLLVGTVVLGALYYMGLLPRDMPLIGRFWLRLDGALVMRSLAQTVRHSAPIAQSVRQISVTYPKRSVARRLATAAQSIERGGHWCDSLQRVGLIRGADAAVLQSAQRVGNLAWALEEMADSTVRRLIYRLSAWLNVIFPCVLIGFGICVLMIVVGIFMPLVGMIWGLA